jgi:hypothetical protein
MRYGKAALLLFGLGMLLGLVVVAADVARLERVASTLMALGLLLIPIGLLADLRRSGLAARLRMQLTGGHRRPRRPARSRPKSRRRASARRRK